MSRMVGSSQTMAFVTVASALAALLLVPAGSGFVPPGDLERGSAPDLLMIEDRTSTHVLGSDPAASIRPATFLLVNRPGTNVGCTANYIWTDGPKLYLGATGRCLLGPATATHGPDADYDPSLTSVRACVRECDVTFVTPTQFIVSGEVVDLGPVVYARNSLSPQGDLGLVEIPETLRTLVLASMPVWGGPRTVEKLEIGSTFGFVGHGTRPETMARTGNVVITDTVEDDDWIGWAPIGFGDVGAPVIHFDVNWDDPAQVVETGIRGRGAAGFILGVLISPIGNVLGTQVTYARTLPLEAGLSVDVLLED